MKKLLFLLLITVLSSCGPVCDSYVARRIDTGAVIPVRDWYMDRSFSNGDTVCIYRSNIMGSGDWSISTGVWKDSVLSSGSYYGEYRMVIIKYQVK